MELVAGGTVMPPHRQWKPMPVPFVRSYFRDLLDGLEYLHSHHVVHRDVKVENVLITHDHVVKLMDLGVACEPDAADDAMRAHLRFAFDRLMALAGTPAAKGDQAAPALNDASRASVSPAAQFVPDHVHVTGMGTLWSR